MPAPIAAALGSSSRKTSRAPLRSAASRMAFCSTDVMFVGAQIRMRGWLYHFLPPTFLNEVLQHHFRNFEIGDNTVSQRTNGDDVTRRPPHHAAGLFADGEHPFCLAFNRDNGRFIQDHAPTFHMNQDVSGPQIYADILT